MDEIKTGREDYAERKQARIDRYNDAAEAASRRSAEAEKRSHDMVKDIPLGQPNINGTLTGVYRKSTAAMEKAVAESDKAAYYSEKAETAASNKAISSDDPEAIEKLKAKIERLKAEREAIKERNRQAKKNGTEPAPWYALPYIGRDIKAAEKRIRDLTAVSETEEETIEFPGGRIESRADINRITVIHDEWPGEDVINRLKTYGFRWSPSVKAWVILRTPTATEKAKRACGIKQ